MNVMSGKLQWGLTGLVVLLVGCAMQVNQPDISAPHARLVFSAAMHLIAIDDQAITQPTPISALRVTPGQHTLRFAHVNAGPEGSEQHAGQHAAPFTLNVWEGLAYHFTAKT